MIRKTIYTSLAILFTIQNVNMANAFVLNSFNKENESSYSVGNMSSTNWDNEIFEHPGVFKLFKKISSGKYERSMTLWNTDRNKKKLGVLFKKIFKKRFLDNIEKERFLTTDTEYQTQFNTFVNGEFNQMDRLISLTKGKNSILILKWWKSIYKKEIKDFRKEIEEKLQERKGKDQTVDDFLNSSFFQETEAEKQNRLHPKKVLTKLEKCIKINPEWTGFCDPNLKVQTFGGDTFIRNDSIKNKYLENVFVEKGYELPKDIINFLNGDKVDQGNFVIIAGEKERKRYDKYIGEDGVEEGLNPYGLHGTFTQAIEAEQRFYVNQLFGKVVDPNYKVKLYISNKDSRPSYSINGRNEIYVSAFRGFISSAVTEYQHKLFDNQFRETKNSTYQNFSREMGDYGSDRTRDQSSKIYKKGKPFISLYDLEDKIKSLYGVLSYLYFNYGKEIFKPIMDIRFYNKGSGVEYFKDKGDSNFRINDDWSKQLVAYSFLESGISKNEEFKDLDLSKGYLDIFEQLRTHILDKINKIGKYGEYGVITHQFEEQRLYYRY